MSPRVPSAQAQRRIADATARLLQTRRFRELTVEDVMEEAGLARTIFYRHFDSLAAVVLALIDEAAAAAEPETPDGLHGMLAQAVDRYARHGRLLAAVAEAAHHDPAVQAAYSEAFESSVEATTAFLSHYVIEPRPLARALMHLNASYLTDMQDPEEALRTLSLIWGRVLGS